LSFAPGTTKFRGPDSPAHLDDSPRRPRAPRGRGHVEHVHDARARAHKKMAKARGLATGGVGGGRDEAQEGFVEPSSDGAEHDVVSGIHSGTLDVGIPKFPDRGCGFRISGALDHVPDRRVRRLLVQLDSDVRSFVRSEGLEHKFPSENSGGRVDLVGDDDVLY
jgi:hypothetical protein